MRKLPILKDWEIYRGIVLEQPDTIQVHFDDYNVHLSAYSYPDLLPNELQSCIKELSYSINPEVVLRRYKIFFAFNEGNISALISNSAFFSTHQKFTAHYILYSYIGWKLTRTSNDFPPLALFTALASITDFSELPKLQFLAISAFYNLFMETFAKRKCTEIKAYMQPMVLYLSQNRDLPEECYNLILVAIQNFASQNGFPTELKEFIYFATNLDLPPSIAQSLLQTIVYQLSSLDTSALVIFSRLVPITQNDPNIEHFMEMFAGSLFNYSKNVTNIREINGSEKISVLQNQAVSGVFEFFEHFSFKGSLNLEETLYFPDKIQYREIFGEDLLKKIDLVYECVESSQKLTKILIESCISGIISNDAPDHQYLVVAMVFYLLARLSSQENSSMIKIEKLSEGLFNDYLFSPKFSVYDPQEGFEIISTLRTAALEIAFHFDISICQQFLKNITQYPMLCSEIVHRLITVNTTPQQAQYIIMNHFMDAAQHFRIAAPSHPECLKPITAIFIYIYTHFQQQEIADACFLTRNFSQSFLAFLFEPMMRQFILSETRTFLVAENETRKQNDLRPVIGQLVDIIGISNDSFPSEASINLSSDAVQVINDVIVHKWSLAKQFEPLLSTFLQKSILTQSEVSRTYLDNIIQFMALISTQHTMTGPELASLEAIVRTVYDVPPQQVFFKILQIAASGLLPSLNPSIIIRQPKVLRTIISLYKGTSTFGNVIKFISEICAYSYKNSVACHTGEIDVMILNIMMSDPESELLPLLFEAFNRISTVTSSVSVVQRYISLLCPTNDQLSPLHTAALQALSQNLYTTRRMPIASMPFSDTSYVKVFNVTPSDLERGFAMTIWIYHDTPSAQYKPRILLLEESAEKQILITCSSNQLIVTHKSDEYDTVATIELAMPPKQWMLLSIEYAKDERGSGSFLVASANCTDPKKISLPPLTWKKKTVQCIIGGIAPDSINVEYASRFANFGLFRSLTESHLISMFESGPRIDPPPYDETIICARNTLKRNELSFEVAEAKFGATLAFEYKQKQTLVSLSEILGLMCKVEFLLPLFSHLDLTTTKGERPHHVVDTIIDVFSNALSMCSRAQQLFVESNGFEIVSHLLLESPSHLNYQLYLRFFGINDSISVPELQYQLFSSILLNVNLLIHCDAQNHLRIVRHWARQIYSSYPSLFMSIKPMHELITMIRLYYYTVAPSGKAFESIVQTRPENLNIKECSRNIVQIIMSMAKTNSLTNEEFLFLIGSIVTNSDPGVSLEYLMLLNSLLDQNPEVFKKVSVDYISVLILTFNFNDENIIITVFRIIWAAHKAQLLKTAELYEHVEIIFYQMTNDIVRPAVFNGVLGMLADGFSELFPIAVWMAANLGERKINELVDLLMPDVKYKTHPSWLFWPVVLLYKVSDAKRDKVLEFIIQSDPDNQASIYMMIDLLGEMFGFGDKEIKNLFLMKICTKLLNEKCTNTAKIAEFFDMARSFIFYDNINDALNTLFKFSPFFMPVRRPRSSTAIPKSPETNRRRQASIHILSPAPNHQGEKLLLSRNRNLSSSKLACFMWLTPGEIDATIAKFEQKKKEKHAVFNLRIGADGEWLDANLAMKCMELFMLFNQASYLDFDLLLCVFLVPYYYDIVRKHFKDLQMSQNEAQSYEGMLKLINNKCIEFSHPPLFKLSSKATHFSAFTEFEKVANANVPTILYGATIEYNKLMRFYSSIKEKSDNVLQTCNEMTAASTAPRHMIYDMQKIQRDNEKKWLRLWRCMTIDGAPWAPALPSTGSEIPLKRDNSACLNFCPAKMKRSWTHKQATLGLEASGSAFFLLSQKTPHRRRSRFDSDSSDTPERRATIVSLEAINEVDVSISSQAVMLRKLDGALKEIKIEDISFILPRSRFHHQSALEFFIKGGKSLFLNFELTEFQGVFSQLRSMHLLTPPNVEPFTTRWRNGKMSNFEYLMKLNIFSGRSFKDISQYPIMPWVIVDYESDEYDIEDPLFLRDFRKPVSQLGQDRLNRIVEVMKKKGVANFALPGSVLRPIDICALLGRLRPFNEIFNGKYASIAEAFTRATCDDECFSELPPELFFLPEALIKTNPDDPTPDIVVPPWANDAFDFVYLNRKALESDLVSNALNQWIDLIWGVKQRGPGAISTFNQFKPQVYEKSTPESAIETGLAPGRLFADPHPPKLQKVPSMGSMAQSITIQTTTQNVIYANIRRDGTKTAIILFGSDGSIATHMVDLAQMQRYVNEGHRSRRRQTAINIGAVSSNDLARAAMYGSIANIAKDSGNADSGGIVSSFSFERLQVLSMQNQAGGIPQNKRQSRGITETSSVDRIAPPPSSTVRIQKFTKPGSSKRSDQYAMIGRTTLAYVNGGVISLADTATGSTREMNTLSSDVTQILSNKEWTVTASKGAVLTVYRTRDIEHYAFSIPLYRDSILAIAASTAFNLVVAATRDGFIFLVSLTRGTSGAVIDLQGARPHMCLVTPGWGFIIAYTTELDRGTVRHSLSLYSVNGRFIRKRTIAHPVAAWSAFKSVDGFDYVVLADDRGTLWSMEAFYLDINKPLFRCNTGVVSVAYSVDHSACVAVTNNGKVIFVPLSVK